MTVYESIEAAVDLGDPVTLSVSEARRLVEEVKAHSSRILEKAEEMP